ncbi:MAG: ABC transporter permease [Bacteroidota bacterium]
MTLSNLKQSLRILFREKRITLINITGLSISLACALLMLLWVQHEMSYDKFHEKYRQLYRVEEDQYYSGEEPYHVNVTPYISGPVWKDEVPEIQEQCRLAYTGGQLFTYGENKFFEDDIRATDSSFFNMFSFPFKFGNKDNVLCEPNSMVITEEISTKYFGDENPVGNTILVNQDQNFTVAGVVYDPPRNTVLGFKVLVSWAFIEKSTYYQDHWGTNSIQTFVKLREGSIDTVVNRKITEVTNIYKENNTIDFSVAPLSGIHLHSYFGFGRSPGGHPVCLYFHCHSPFCIADRMHQFHESRHSQVHAACQRDRIEESERGIARATGQTAPF